MIRTIVCVSLLAIVPVVSAQEPKDFFFKKGDRIVFLGDSITEQYQYSSYIELYLTTRFPAWDLTFLNAGIGGDTAGGGAGRFQNHVLAEKPTAVTINFGMNDGGYGAFNPQSAKNFAENTRKMLDMAKKASVRVAVLSPNAVDRRVNPKFKLYLETQKEFYAPLKDLAKDHGMAFVDQYALTRDALERMEKDDPAANKVRPFGDGFHTSSPGGLLMAHAILTGLKAPALVSDVEISFGNNSAKTKGCKVDRLDLTKSGLSFRRLDDALPMPVQKDWLSVVPYMKEIQDLNWYGLKVTGLQPDRRYHLMIDDQNVAVLDGATLGQGINVGNLQSGPIYNQGQKVLQAIGDKNKVVHGRFRGVVMFNPKTLPDWLQEYAAKRHPEELTARTERIQKMQADIYKLAQPVAHEWELIQTK